MPNNVEIVMDIDTLEIFEVIDLDKEKEVSDIDTFSEETKPSPYDDLNRVWLGSGYYYKPASLLWKAEKEGIIHELKPKNKHGTYPYHSYVTGQWGHVSQLSQEEALWLTLEFNPELMDYV